MSKHSATKCLWSALYHLPKPLYNSTELLDYVERGVEVLSSMFPDATIVLAGDFNTLDDSTRGKNILDRIYVNDLFYATVRVVASTVKSDHRAIFAYIGQLLQPLNKTRQRCVQATLTCATRLVSQIRVPADHGIRRR